ncbi:MAG: 6-phosphogluconate dehydrogenase (decarboxylating) [Hydrogenophilales bacterium CG03_land_8_20_14_0_80_62_28]|nr:MAG: 6-phosphogluconate dehydrogenase (decarboxylating) [Hydrogenophilaceae bacterium CG1_02_62_390]PIV21670.1 MAG: 6-phosphogluconate dehydrogenase (decarboxylating) [Hydrogenophilales bacterium CG03_land_8_20_14_0_80_62_28]PIW38192.1 MAG: 6-phosphogluconate dehydrogenase (decarboxylating) [Hydrogenophilales bacterium CG15_BIG_FIL_POST_REV_8_21_14_020_62_31]PIW72345.1 MAG: 6-phosphogluconate dehydrogenase (decarboxylating) [Hydrogenophilales bacterium CG12_big_fil_rev_8_21_14_0_65_61_21]PIY
MQIAMVGLGRMGANMARRLLRDGHDCVVYDRDPDAVARLVAEGATGVASLADLAGKLRPPRAAWIMVPSGEITENAVRELASHFAPGDVIVDGGNSYFKDDVRRAGGLRERGIHYLDAGTSGGVWGLERGYCLMVGGDRAAYDRLEPVFLSLAPGGSGIPPSPGRTPGSSAEQGYLYCGPSGAGHFAKMVHNGIEYGLMQAYAEGFDILKNANAESLPADQRYDLNLADLTELWRRGSVVTSWLLDLSAEALARNPDLSNYSGFVQDSGEGRWTVQAAIDEAVPAEVLTAALFARFRSRQQHTFAEKALSAMRQGFGGHVEPGK